MIKETKEVKQLLIRMPKETWVFLKNTAIAQETTMNEIVMRCVNKYKKKLENKLTGDD